MKLRLWNPECFSFCRRSFHPPVVNSTDMSFSLISLIVHYASTKHSRWGCACVSVERFHWSILQPICLAGLFTKLHLRQEEPSLQESSLNLSSLCSLLLFCFSTGLGKVNEKIRSADTPHLTPPQPFLPTIIFLQCQRWLVHLTGEWWVTSGLHLIICYCWKSDLLHEKKKNFFGDILLDYKKLVCVLCVFLLCVWSCYTFLVFPSLLCLFYIFYCYCKLKVSKDSMS